MPNQPESEAMTGRRTAPLRHQRSSKETRRGFGREYELQEVIQHIEVRLARLARIRTRAEHDEQLDAVEAVAGPYAIAFVYEIRRLEQLLNAQGRQIERRGARRRNSGPMRSGRMLRGAAR
jgi:hypothetical protein